MFISIVITFPYTQKGMESLFQALFFFPPPAWLSAGLYQMCEKPDPDSRESSAESTAILVSQHDSTECFWEPFCHPQPSWNLFFLFSSLFFAIIHFRRCLEPALNIIERERERKYIQKKKQDYLDGRYLWLHMQSRLFSQRAVWCVVGVMLPLLAISVWPTCLHFMRLKTDRSTVSS